MCELALRLPDQARAVFIHHPYYRTIHPTTGACASMYALRVSTRAHDAPATWRRRQRHAAAPGDVSRMR